MIQNVFLLVFLAGFASQLMSTFGRSQANVAAGTNDTNSSDKPTTHEKVEFEVATFDFNYVAGPFTIMLWIFIASFAKLGFHFSQKLSSIIPESSLVIMLGILIGIILRVSGLTNEDVPFFSSKIFFLFMLPPIVLEAGYFLQDKAFFDNIGTILLFAVVGTLFNTFAVGLSLYGVSRTSIGLPLMHSLLFGALISAVDPVAVLAVFEEVNVNVMLYILVFGESILNDAVTVVLYHLFEKLAVIGYVTYKEVLLGLTNFFVVSLGGTAIGLIWGIATAFTTKYTDHVRVIEPIFVFVMSYMAYLCAEMFHFSGIMSIITCAIVMKPYVEMNISRKSHTTIKYFMKMMSSSSETLIFMFLGMALVTYEHDWRTDFVLLTLLFVTVFRAIGVVSLTFLANRFGRLNKLSAVDQFIMSYGGIRGAVSFSLAILLNKDHFPQKNMIVTTTIAVVIFTIFFQGTTIKPLVKALRVKLKSKQKLSMYSEMNVKLLEHMVEGIEEISGFRGHGYYWALMEHFHFRYLRVWLIRDNDCEIHDEDILLAYRKLEYKDALTHLECEGTGSLLLTSRPDTEDENDEEEQPLMLRGGALVRCPDAVQRDWKAGSVPPDSVAVEETHHTLSYLLENSGKNNSHRKFQRNNVIEDGIHGLKSNYLVPRSSRPLGYVATDAKPRGHHKHRKHHKRGRHKKHELADQPLKKNLSTIFEPQGDELSAEKKEEERHSDAKKASDSAKDGDDDPGITFTAATPHWRIGRFPSVEETELDQQISTMNGNGEERNQSPRASPETAASESSEGKSKDREGTNSAGVEDDSVVGDRGRGSKEDIPLKSFVVDIEDSPPSASKRGGKQDTKV